MLEQKLGIPKLSNTNTFTELNQKFLQKKVEKKSILDAAIKNQPNDLIRLFFYTFFTNMFFEKNGIESKFGMNLAYGVNMLQELNWGGNFNEIYAKYCASSLEDIEIFINSYNFMTKISDFFTKYSLKKIEQSWEFFNIQSIHKLSDIFISENLKMFQGLEDKVKELLIEFFKKLFIKIVSTERTKVENENNTEIKLGLFIFEQDVYIDDLASKLKDNISIFLKNKRDLLVERDEEYLD